MAMTRCSDNALVVAVVAMAVLTGSGLLGEAMGQGSMEDPISRAYACAKRPTSAACIAAVAVSGNYDWNKVSIPDAAGRHRELIPDGELCSAGQAKYAGLDLARDDWPSTSLSSAANFTFLYKATTPHSGYFEFYITQDGYDPTEAIKWSDLGDTPFINVTDPELVSGDYQIPGITPSGKDGRHLIYIIWQRTDSPEAFYSCSDVVFSDEAHLALRSTT